MPGCWHLWDYSGQSVHPYVIPRVSWGSAQRKCVLTRRRRWATGLNCSAQANFDNAAWQLTQSDTTVAGVCLPGFRAGAPLRACGIDGQWDVNVVNPCQGMAFVGANEKRRAFLTVGSAELPSLTALACPALANANGTAYSAVAAGSVATGTCLPGFGPGGSGSGSPTRACDLLGNWAATDTNPCQRTSHPRGSNMTQVPDRACAQRWCVGHGPRAEPRGRRRRRRARQPWWWARVLLALKFWLARRTAAVTLPAPSPPSRTPVSVRVCVWVKRDHASHHGTGTVARRSDHVPRGAGGRGRGQRHVALGGGGCGGGGGRVLARLHGQPCARVPRWRPCVAGPLGPRRRWLCRYEDSGQRPAGLA
jgi:hypothetical protein